MPRAPDFHMRLNGFGFVRIVTLLSLGWAGCSESSITSTDAGLDVSPFDAGFDVPTRDAGREPAPDVSPGIDAGPPFDAGLDAGPIGFGCWEGSTEPPAVQARRGETVDDYHGERVEDPYRWMEDDGAELDTHISSAQVATDAHLRLLHPAQLQRLEELRRASDLILPRTRGGLDFFARRPEGEQRSAVFVQDGDDERLLINPNEWPDHTTLGQWSPSPDGLFVLYMESMNNSDAGVIFVVETSTGAILDGGMMSPRLSFYSATWALDSSGFYYANYSAGMGTQYFHELSTPIGDDVDVGNTPVGSGSVFEASGGSERFLSAGNRLYRQDLTTSGRNESVYTLAVDPRSVSRGFSYSGDSTRIYANEISYVHPRGAVYIADDGPAEGWEVLIPERDGALQSWAAYNGGAAAVFVENGMAVVRAFAPGGVEIARAPIPDFGSARLQAGGDEVAIYFSGIFDSPRVFRWNPSEETMLVAQAAEQPVTLNRGSYLAEVHVVAGRLAGAIREPQIFVPLITPAGAPADGSTPTLLYAYGGFRASFTPFYSPRHALWLEAGGAVALPQLRGGGEQGLQWWAEGAFERKQVTYDDLYSVVEELAAMGVTSAEHLVINGVSNGGLTMSVAITQRPELFAAAAIEAPLTDMLRYHASGTGWAWVNEYGSSERPGEFETLRRYSPFHAAEDQGCMDYPATIVVTGLADDRVVPWHAYKMAATLAEHTTFNPIVLHTSPTASHSGSAFDTENLATDVAVLSFTAEASGLPLF